MKKIRRNGLLALILMVSMVLSDILPSMALTVQAGQEKSAQQEKQLLQCSNNWTIFRSVNDGIPSFEVYYMDKTLEELQEEGLHIKYRIIDTISTSHIYTWEDFNDKLFDELKNISNYTNLIQFTVIGDSNSMYSDAFSITPRNNPYILSSAISTFPTLNNWVDFYSLVAYPNTFKLTLKISENLSGENNASVLVDADGLDSYLIGSYSASNLSYENKTENYTVDGKNYTLKYSNVTFDVEVASKANTSNMPTSPRFCYVTYNFNFNGFEGSENHTQPVQFSIWTQTPVEKNTSVESITIDANEDYVIVGDNIKLSAKIAPSDATDKSVTWSSSNTEYATVDANGVVTANEAGAGKTVTITATAGDGSGVTGTYTLTIVGVTDDTPVKEITIHAPSSTVKPGNKVNLSATVTPEDATDKSVTWSSSNTAYATVDANGVVTTKAAGAGKSVVITATANDGSGVKSTFNINIKKVNVTKISLSTTTKTVQAGKKATVKAAIAPTNATNKAITWTSSNKKYATVSSKGVVTTKKAGIGKTVTITAKAKDGSGKKTSIKIKIVKTVKVSKIKLKASSKTVKAGKKVTVKAAITPVNATNRGLTWTSSNKKYATVNKKGVVTAKKAGKGKTVTITAKTNDGSGKKATVKIKVK